MMTTQRNTYYLPAEYQKQMAVMLTWPHTQNPWADLNTIEPVLVEITYHIARYQTVLITHLNDPHYEAIISLLKKRGVNLNRVFFHEAQSDDIWIRDYGPLTVYKNKRLHLLNFQFNGWGNKYPLANDNNLIERLHVKNALGNIPLERVNMVLEGGSIEVDGYGTLLTTRRCLLEKNRNPHLNEKQIEEQLKKYFGITRVFWLDHGYLEGDDTDGHIDTLVRFTERTITYMQCTDRKDTHFPEFNAMEKQLKSWINYHAKPYDLIPLPWPKPVYSKIDGRRLPASYANFLIINDAVLVPIYNDPADIQALARLNACFPQRTIIPINCIPLLEGGGSLHCITMQISAREIAADFREKTNYP